MSAIYIVGLNHFLQNLANVCLTDAGRDKEQKQKASLRALLSEIIVENGIKLIAEEGKPHCKCLGHQVAEEHKVAHVDITMPISEREKHGIITPDYDKQHKTRDAAYAVFERHMFDTSVAQKIDPILVLCGRRHLTGLVGLFSSMKGEVKPYDLNDYEWYLGIPQESAAGVVGYDRED